MSSIRRLLRQARRLAALARAERSLARKAPLLERIRFWRKGFLSQAPVIYGLSDEQAMADNYVSDYGRYVLAGNVNSDNGLLNNKLMCHFLAESLLGGVNARLFAVVIQGRLYPVDCPHTDIVDWLADYLGSGNSLIVKPIHGAKGRGVRRIDRWEDLSSWMQGTTGGLIYERLTQHSYAERIFPKSLNTIRVVTMVDNDGPFVASSVHRFGTTASAPVDNWSSAGLCAAINPETGVIGEAVQHPKYTEWDMKWLRRHPDTNAMIDGVQVPNWQDVVIEVLSFASTMRFLPYLAWDLALTNNGLRVVEINGNSDVDLLQIHGPLLRNDRIRAFYRRYGVIA